MTSKPKRVRANSTEAHVQAIQAAAAGVLPVPEGVSLRECDSPFWLAITQARPRSTWTDVDLRHAATLARTMADIETMQAKLDTEGYTFGDAVNPAFKVMETLSRRAVAMSRMLHIHALATVGRSGDAAGLAALEREARGHDIDDLIPMGRA